MAGESIASSVEALRRDGYIVLESFLSAAVLENVRAGLDGHFGCCQGRKPFEGHRSERAYTLVARGAVFEDIAEDPRLIANPGHGLREISFWVCPATLRAGFRRVCRICWVMPGAVTTDRY